MSWLELAAVAIVAQAEEPVAEEPVDAQTAALLEEAEALNAQFKELNGEGRFAEAEEVAWVVLAILEKRLGPSHSEVATSLSNVGVALQSQGDYAGARPLFERSLAIYEKTLGPDHPSFAIALNNLASLLHSQGDYVSARPLLERSLAIREKVLGPDHPDVANGLNNLATLLKTQGDYKGARPLYERSLAIREKALGPDHPDVAQGLHNLATLLASQGDYTGARQLLERSVAIWENALGPDHRDVAMGLNSLASLLILQGDFAGARPLFERSLAIREKALGPDHPGVAQGLNNLASLLTSQGDYAGSRPLYEHSLAIREKALGPDHPDVAQSLHNLASLLKLQGDFAGARPLYERSLGIWEKALGPNHPNVAQGLNNLAALLKSQGDLDGARPLFERSLAIREKALGPDHPDVAQGLNNLASLLRSQGDFAGARPLLERSLAIREKALGPDHPSVAQGLNNLATLLGSQGDHTSARQLLERSLAIFETRQDLLDKLSEREALAHVTASRRALDGWLRAFADPADSERAWTRALRWKGVATRRIHERVNTRMLADPEAQALHQRLAAKKSALARVTFADYDMEKVEQRRAQKVELTKEKEKLERQLAATSAAWRGERDIERANATEICSALENGHALVDFVQYNADYLAFVVVAPDCDVHRVELGGAASLDDALRGWREALATNMPRAFTKRIDARGDKMREVVWEPLESAIAEADELIIVPDGALSALPFGALPMRNGGYLIEQYPIHYLENAQDLLREPAETSSTGALLVGDVRFGGDEVGTDAVADSEGALSAPCVSGDYGQLSGTVEELDSLSGQWSKGRYRREHAEVLRGESASEANVFAGMPGHRVVHLATHGFFADEKCKSALAGGVEEGQSVVGFNPMLLSGIVLAGANAEHGPLDDYDGILTAEELGAIDLRGTELVVLSACETGLGVVRAGEGVLGLRRAFAAAGVENLVMSLWSVPDEETSQLMEGFYKRVLHRRKPMSPADAMREAQIEMLERNREAYSGDGRPGSWAAFVVAGK